MITKAKIASRYEAKMNLKQTKLHYEIQGAGLKRKASSLKPRAFNLEPALY